MQNQESVEVLTFKFEDDGSIPNNPYFPLLIYKKAVSADRDLEKLLAENQWLDSWKNGIFDYHHYHSNSHEVLVVISGQARVQFGGEQGELIKAETGDVIIIPAGVGHKRIEASSDFTVMGAYPDGKEYDTCYGKAEERPEKLENIKGVPRPKKDPIFGSEGPLFSYWSHHSH